MCGCVDPTKNDFLLGDGEENGGGAVDPTNTDFLLGDGEEHGDIRGVDPTNIHDFLLVLLGDGEHGGGGGGL